MFILICPNCQQKLKPQDGFQLKADDWIRCPFCQEVFHPQAIDALNFLSEPENHPIRAPDHPRRAMVKALTEDISQSIAHAPIGAADLPAMASRPDRTQLWKALAGGLAVATILFVMGLLFFLAKPPTPPMVTPRPPLMTRDYATAFLPGDFKSLKAALRKTRLAYKKIEYRGYESRIYNYFAEKAGEDFCQDISSLTIYSDNTGKGFRAMGVCVDEKSPTPELEVDWRSVDQIMVSVIENHVSRLLGIVNLNQTPPAKST
ncbi:MAG: hypothetical protein LBT86_00140 [Deltaproteobacteria bacterium]|jgi:hypothetical protein|nr:hypothetical protein [Deltaproteobacteria bacterium]